MAEATAAGGDSAPPGPQRRGPAEVTPAALVTPLLRADGVSLSFGGLTALDDVSFSVRPGELVALIGPNGAGKTSMFNCISGVYRPERGALLFEETELIGMRPSRIAAAGVARTFQNLALFENLDVVDNLMLGRHTLMRTGLLAGAAWFGRARREEIRHRRRCAELVDFLGLGAYVGRPVGLLPYGVQKRIEIGRALAAEPRLLMLDEPVAGMTRAERDETGDLLSGIRAEMGLTMLLVEHHMHLVLEVADRVVAMNFGAVIASGGPDEVANHPAVVEAYLGTAGTNGNGAAH
ncbi:MAG: ABC transporter ATP-binding protein [bacterium]|nr:ABC transporter ATP-binding protein [bacterium]